MNSNLPVKSCRNACLALLLTALVSPIGHARDVTVGIANGNALAFFPAVTNILTGDRVIWVWNNTVNQHSTTDTGLWDSGLHPAPQSFTNTFNSTGTFNYFCSLHSGFGMTGKVIVSAPPQPPSLAITNPLAGAVFATPASVTIQVAVTNGSSAVTNVQFLLGGSLLTNKTAAPFSVTASNLAVNSYVLLAIAADGNGLKATNTASISVVTPIAVNLTAPASIPPMSFQFSYSANAGLRYVVERSTNFANWLALATNTAPAGLVNFLDTNALWNPAFYRVVRLPNP